MRSFFFSPGINQVSTVKVSSDNVVEIESMSDFDECELFFDLDITDIRKFYQTDLRELSTFDRKDSE